jgi:transcriptional regulator with XRE-family HTH domain
VRNLVGPRVRQARVTLDPPLTQADLAARLEVRGLKIDRAGVAKIEAGLRQVSDVELVQIAAALGVPPSWLLSERAPSPGMPRE